METIAAIVILFPAVPRAHINRDGSYSGWNHDDTELDYRCYHPPVGVCLFVTANIANISLVRITKAIFPFIVANIVVLMMVSFIPSLTLYLPRLILGH